MKDITGLSLKELGIELTGLGYEPYRARQVFSWIYKTGVREFSAMSDLPAGLRVALRDNYRISNLKCLRKKLSSDGTEKFLFQLRDRNLIEAVSIPASARVTGCVSSQAGCRFACGFCASGSSGFKRDLACAEIMEEVLYLKHASKAKRLTHLVFMGIGEPLDNYENVMRSIRLINSADGLNIGARRITISTCGIIPGIRRLAKEGLQVELSISLHAADNATRSSLMPVNKIYPLKELMRACAEYIQKTGRQITFEYVLLNGVNSSLQNARDLSIILKGLGNCKVNFIPANRAAGSKMFPATAAGVRSFRDFLLTHGVVATVRRERGADIEGACGQLRSKHANV